MTQPDIEKSDNQMYIHLGPQHPINHGLWTLKIRTDAERVTEAECLIGYIYRMIEKMAENRPYDTFQPLANRLCYVSGLSWEASYILAVEKLMEIDISDRTRIIRVILLELQRIASHLTWLSAFAADVGLLTMLVISFREREYTLDILEHTMGSRMMYNYLRVGGLKHDIPTGFESDCYSLCDYLDSRIKEYPAILDDSSIFRMRTKKVGILSKDDAINLGATGPCLRASGVQEDIRKLEPYLGYNDFNFAIPVETTGDCWARYQVRMKEMKESVKIIRQALDILPKGEISQKVPKKLPEGEVYFRTEDPRGEGAFYIRGNNTRIPYRVKIKSPAYSNLALLNHMLKGQKVADLAAIVASIDLCMGEIDR